MAVTGGFSQAARVLASVMAEARNPLAEAILDYKLAKAAVVHLYSPATSEADCDALADEAERRADDAECRLVALLVEYGATPADAKAMTWGVA